MAQQRMIWKSLGLVWGGRGASAPPLEGSYALPGVDGDRAPYIETQLRGMAMELMNTMYEQGGELRPGITTFGVRQSSTGEEFTIMFDHYPTTALMLVERNYMLMPVSSIAPN